MEHPLTPYVDVDVIEPWTDRWRFRQERKLWYHVMQFQAGYGVFDHVDDLDAKLDAYAKATTFPVRPADLDQIETHERVTKHDVKARIEVFNELASDLYWKGEPIERIELAHAGMTSADVVDNISLIQMVECARRLAQLAEAKGKAATAEVLHTVADTTPMRGIKGPVGTQQDMLDLFKDPDAIGMLEAHLCGIFDVPAGTLNSVGQVYPRSLDLQIGSRIVLSMWGMQPWHTIASGYLSMIATYSGDQWNEGDVSTSVVRRVALPGIFLACGAAIGREDV